LLNDPDIDLVVIATPNDTHFPLAKAALEAGKHVVVDKPFTVTLSQARELESLAKHCGRVLSVFHNRRWDSDFLTVSALINEGQLGRCVTSSRISIASAHRCASAGVSRRVPAVAFGMISAASARPGGGAVWPAGEHHGGSRSTSARRAIHRLFSRRAGLSQRRVVLHGTLLAAAESARFIVHGSRASYIKYGLDPQEERLKTVNGCRRRTGGMICATVP
jgi:predicted dehydrogenase